MLEPSRSAHRILFDPQSKSDESTQYSLPPAIANPNVVFVSVVTMFCMLGIPEPSKIAHWILSSILQYRLASGKNESMWIPYSTTNEILYVRAVEIRTPDCPREPTIGRPVQLVLFNI